MDKIHYFWFSRKQLDQKLNHSFPWCYGYGNFGFSKNRNFALIDGKVVEYTVCSERNQHGCMWDDLKFLGTGTYHHSEKI